MANGTQRSKARKPREVRKGPDPITEDEFKWMARYLRRKADLPRGVRVRWILDSDIHEQGWNGTCDDHETTTRFTIGWLRSFPLITLGMFAFTNLVMCANESFGL